jgi:hypothetical protein
MYDEKQVQSCGGWLIGDMFGKTEPRRRRLPLLPARLSNQNRWQRL